jgi:hypothetical protein
MSRPHGTADVNRERASAPKTEGNASIRSQSREQMLRIRQSLVRLRIRSGGTGNQRGRSTLEWPHCSLALLPKAAKSQLRYRICRPGHQRALDSEIRSHARLGATAEDFVTRAQLPKALASFGSGENVRFGKLHLGPDGLRYPSPKHPRFLPLSALAGVSVTQYAVKVRQAGHRFAWLTAERKDVPNAAVLAALAEHIVTGRPHDGDQADSSRAPDTQ